MHPLQSGKVTAQDFLSIVVVLDCCRPLILGERVLVCISELGGVIVTGSIDDVLVVDEKLLVGDVHFERTKLFDANDMHGNKRTAKLYVVVSILSVFAMVAVVGLEFGREGVEVEYVLLISAVGFEVSNSEYVLMVVSP